MASEELRKTRMKTKTSARLESTHTASTVPTLLTTAEIAALLRTSIKAVYAMVERGQLPGVVRIGRRVLVRQDALVDWLGQKSQALSPESRER
jgi:excisionase family DNA binding protein